MRCPFHSERSKVNVIYKKRNWITSNLLPSTFHSTHVVIPSSRFTVATADAIHIWSWFWILSFFLLAYAWVTLATNDSYSLGALVVAHSLKKVSTLHQLVVLITPGVSESMRGKLQDVFNVVQLVDVLDSNDSANLAVLKRPELGITFTKLHCWNLTQFEKCVFLDADVLVSNETFNL